MKKNFIYISMAAFLAITTFLNELAQMRGLTCFCFLFILLTLSSCCYEKTEREQKQYEDEQYNMYTPEIRHLIELIQKQERQR